MAIGNGSSRGRAFWITRLARPTRLNVAIRQSEVLVVPDALNDPRFAETGLVKGDPHIRFYAGAQLRSPEGHGLGALCIVDTKPREFGANEIAILRDG